MNHTILLFALIFTAGLAAVFTGHTRVFLALGVAFVAIVTHHGGAVMAMPMIYGISLATAGNLTTNGSANTETDAFFVKAGAGRSVFMQSLYLIGKGAGLTAISGIAMRLIKLGTASTGGTGITPNPKDPGMQAAKATAASRPAIGSTRTNHLVVGCGAAGPGGWVNPNPDSVLLNEAGSAGSIDGVDISGTVSLNYEWSGEVGE